MTLRRSLAGILLSCGVWATVAPGAAPETAPARPRNYGMRSPRTVVLKPCRDPFPQAQPRFRDIADILLTDFQRGGSFDYGAATVALTYDTRPQFPYFIGHISATGLKPNFAYQLKLAGKPRDGARGWGDDSDDLTNRRIGYAGRWWCDSEQINVPDRHFEWLYANAPRRSRHTVYGYLFMGDVVTDEHGNADLTFDGSHSYHITWADRQSGRKDVVAGIYKVQSLIAPYYGYGAPVAPREVRLWYEYESHRSHRVRLPEGKYDCRFVLEEETFHNHLDDGTKEGGGYWIAVMANEELGAPDPDNAVRWSIEGR